jgi:hypothetical protein
MVFGRKKEASLQAVSWTRVTPPRPAVDGQSRRPTDVAWDTQENIERRSDRCSTRTAAR